MHFKAPRRYPPSALTKAKMKRDEKKFVAKGTKTQSDS